MSTRYLATREKYSRTKHRSCYRYVCFGQFENYQILFLFFFFLFLITSVAGNSRKCSLNIFLLSERRAFLLDSVMKWNSKRLNELWLIIPTNCDVTDFNNIVIICWTNYRLLLNWSTSLEDFCKIVTIDTYLESLTIKYIFLPTRGQTEIITSVQKFEV